MRKSRKQFFRYVPPPTPLPPRRLIAGRAGLCRDPAPAIWREFRWLRTGPPLPPSPWPPAVFLPIETLEIWTSGRDEVALTLHSEETEHLALADGGILELVLGEALVNLSLSYESALALILGVQDMPPEQTLRIIRAQDLSVKCTMAPPRDLTGWSISFVVKDSLTGSTAITKTVGAGVTITDGPRGIITLSLAKADTSGLTVTTGLSAGKGYVFEIKRTDSGSNLVLARGQLILEQEVIA